MPNNKREPCELFRMVPRDQLKYIFNHSEAGASLDFSFLGFERVYKNIPMFVPKDKVIIDLGCAFGIQSWYFQDYKEYIGIDAAMNNDSVLHTKNSKYYYVSIQEFITNIFETLEYRNEDVFAICSYVPDDKARKMVRNYFQNCLVYYPSSRV